MDKIINATFQYMVLKLAERFIDNIPGNENLALWRKFEEFGKYHNSYNKEKCNLFVYLVCSGNGKRTELISLFQGDGTRRYEFFPKQNVGIINRYIESLLNENTGPFFRIDESGDMEIEPVLIEQVKSNASIVELIIDANTITDLEEKEQAKMFFSYIDTSISYIHKNIYSMFANFTLNWLKEHSMNTILFKNYRDIFSSGNNHSTFNREIKEYKTEFTPLG